MSRPESAPATMRAGAWLMLLATLGACQRPGSTRTRERDGAATVAWLRVRLPADWSGGPLHLRSKNGKPLPVRTERLPDGERRLTVRPMTAELPAVLHGRGLCPTEVTLRPGKVQRLAPRPWLRPPAPLDRVGFGGSFEVRLAPGCREAFRGRVDWEVVRGPDVGLDVRAGGLRAAGRLPSAEKTGLLREAPGWGIVPVTPRTRGETVLRATWRGPGEHDGWSLELTVAAVDRASGLPSLAPGQRVLLAGTGWQLVERPPRATARIEPEPGTPWLRFEPDRKGTWRLRDEAGRPLEVRVGRYDETRLDCGRSACHQRATEAAASSPMIASWQRFVARRPDGADWPRCGLGCHAAGEPGHDDGSLHALSLRHGWRLEGGEAAWERLPPLLRRVAGVGCQGCHGPGAIPSPHVRWTVLRSELCGTCHDAPPRYGHLVAWRTTAMARTARRAGVGQPACRGCHTTDGFLERLAVPEVHRPPADEPLGLGCVACHGPHDPTSKGRLLRQPPLPEPLASRIPSDHATERLCAGCHGGLAGRGVPELRALPAQSLRFRGPGEPHGALEDGCLGCHRDGPGEVHRGRSHGFAVDEGACAGGGCHDAGQVPELFAAGRRWRGRLRDLLQARLGGERAAASRDAAALHALPAATTERLPPDLMELVADPAAWVHAPRRARTRLQAAMAAARATRTKP